MRLKALAVLALSAGLLTGACASEESQAGTSDLSRSLLDQPAGDGVSTPIAADPRLSDDGPRVPVSDIGFNRGLAEAPVKVVEMSDYGCGYCRKFHQESFPTLLQQFIEAGMVEWKFVPYITGMWETSLPATEAAECTYAQSPEAFETLNTQLWDGQSEWKGSDDAGAVVRAWVSELGIDMDAYDGCVAQDERIDRIAAATTLARQLGVRGTPTFVVIGYPPLQGALPLETFQELLTVVYNEAVSENGQ